MDPVSDFTDAAHQLRRWTDPETFHYRMRNDPRFAAEVRYVASHGIPWSVFLGRVVAPGQPQWLAEDREVAVAFEQWDGALCPSCGLHPLDWVNERDEMFKGEIRTCHGCTELADTKATIPKDVSDDRRAAMHVFLTPRPLRERLLWEAYELDEIGSLDDYDIG